MISMIDLLVFIAYAVSLAILVVLNIRLSSKRTRLATSLLQLTLEKQALLNALEKSMSEKEHSDIEKTEGFLKFVSDSRDWAFDYIEQVQGSLEKFTNDVDADIKYILKYGQLIEHPLQNSINRIANAYEELQLLMPKGKD
jgi:hypothetical protein